MNNKIKKLIDVLPAILFLAIITAIVEILSRTGVIVGFLIPAPSKVAAALAINFEGMLPHIWETFWVSAIGVLASIIFAFIIAIVMDGLPIVKKTLYPVLVASQTIPIMVITPIIVLLLGFGLAPKILVVVLVCFFPVCISLFDGLASVDDDMIMLMKSMGASKVQILRHVKLPASMPSLFSGIKITATYCIMATVIAEWQGSNTGLGVYMMRVKRSYNYDQMFAAILLIVLLSLLFFAMAQLSEKKMVRWKNKD